MKAMFFILINIIITLCSGNETSSTTLNSTIPKSIPSSTIKAIQSFTVSSTSTIIGLKSIPSTIPKNLTINEPEPEKLLLGVDNYKFENSTIYFFAKFLIESLELFKTEEVFTLNINNNLRFLQNSPINVICYYERNISTIYEYHCNHSYNGNIQSIKLSYNGKMTDYAKYSLDNLQNQKGDIIPLDFIYITNCTIVDEDNAIINGNAGNNNIPNNTNSIMYVLIGDSKEDIPTTFIKKDNNGNYDLKLNLKKDLSSDMNNKQGLVEIDGKNKTYILFFNEDETSKLNYKYNTKDPSTFNKAYNSKKSSSGLSGGAIVAIILPCIAALLAVLGLAFYLGKSSSGAVAGPPIPMENLGNNTIGISSSSNVVNK
jgi:hypothetical protein